MTVARLWVRLVRGDRGANLVEYGLLVALIAVTCIIAVVVLGEDASDRFSSVGDSINNATS